MSDSIMPRTARIVIPGFPHHVTQRGNRRQATFFRNDDYRMYLKLLVKYRRQTSVAIWAYCLMPNHVHLVAVPAQADGLAKLLRLTHHRYARIINTRHGWQGHLWQERFHSCVMDEAHLLAAVRYVELNPVRAGLCARANEWRWSSVRAHLRGVTDPTVDRAPLLHDQLSDWSAYLSADGDGPMVSEIRRCTNSGRPGGDDAFVADLERLTGRRLRTRRPGPRPRAGN